MLLVFIVKSSLILDYSQKNDYTKHKECIHSLMRIKCERGNKTMKTKIKKQEYKRCTMKKHMKMLIMLFLVMLMFKDVQFEVKASTTLDKERLEELLEQLEEEEREYEYQKKIQEIQKTITSLEKKINELSLSTAREDIAMRLQFEAELAEAKRELEDEQKKHDMSPEEIEYYEYRKKVEELQETITNLERKIRELSNSTAREDIAMRLDLEEQLEEKQAELEYIQEKHKMDYIQSELEKIPTTPEKEETPAENPDEDSNGTDNKKDNDNTGATEDKDNSDKNDKEDDKNSSEDKDNDTNDTGSSSGSSSGSGSSSHGWGSSNTETKTMAEMHVSGREEFEAQFKDNYRYSETLGRWYYSDGYQNSSKRASDMKQYNQKYSEHYGTNFDSYINCPVTALEVSAWKLPGDAGRMAYNYTKGVVSSEKGVLTSTAFPFPSKWVNVGGNWMFQYTDGSSPQGQTTFVDGLATTIYDWEFIDGKWYTFNEYAMLSTGWIYDITDESWYFIDQTNGALSGWQEINGKWYYFEPTSNISKGKLLTDTWIGNCYVDGNGVWVQ